MSYVNFNRQRDKAFATGVSADPNTVYFTTDTKQVIIGGLEYGGVSDYVSLDLYSNDTQIFSDTLTEINNKFSLYVSQENYLNDTQIFSDTLTEINNKFSLYVSQENYLNDTQVVSAALNDLNSRLLGITDDLNFLPLTGGTLTGDLFIGEGSTALLGTSQGKVTLYNDTRLDFTGSGTTTMGPTETGFIISNDSELKLTSDTVCVNAADLLEMYANGIALNNVYINSSSEIVFDNNGTKLTQEELNFAYDCGAIKMEEDDVMRIYGEGGIRLDSSVTCISDISAAAFYETSDARKKDIKSDLSLDKCYDLIDKCQTVIYSLKDQTKEQVGMIAQEIEEFFPEVVATDEEGFKSLAYDRLVVICFKVLKDVIKRLEKLENNGSN